MKNICAHPPPLHGHAVALTHIFEVEKLKMLLSPPLVNLQKCCDPTNFSKIFHPLPFQPTPSPAIIVDSSLNNKILGSFLFVLIFFSILLILHKSSPRGEGIKTPYSTGSCSFHCFAYFCIFWLLF